MEESHCWEQDRKTNSGQACGSRAECVKVKNTANRKGAFTGTAWKQSVCLREHGNELLRQISELPVGVRGVKS